MALLVTPRLVLIVLSFMALDTTQEDHKSGSTGNSSISPTSNYSTNASSTTVPVPSPTKGGGSCAADKFTSCVRLLADNIGWAFDIVRLEYEQFQQLCRSAEEHRFCSGILVQNQKCPLPIELSGILPAYRFLCTKPTSSNPGYEAHRMCLNTVPTLRCTGMYPQVLPMAARHILMEADSLVNITFSESMEYRIHHGICIFLSTNREIFCSDFFLGVRCGPKAAEWHTKFKKILFNMPHESLREVTYRARTGFQTVINLSNCSRLKDAKASMACELSNKCVPVLNNFALNVRFGIFTFTDNDLDLFCKLSEEEMEACVSKIVHYCSLVDVYIYNASLKVQDKLCNDHYRTQFEEHRICLSDIATQSQFGTIEICTDELMELYERVIKLQLDFELVETDLCNGAAQYLNCLEAQVTTLCNAKAAAWQRTMVRFMLVQAYQLSYCMFMLGHEDIEQARQGRGESLKVIDLKTVLLIATVTAITFSNYIKSRYYA